jgi:hypothetical protein
VLVLRTSVRTGGPALVREHWRGPQRSLDVILRFAWGRSTISPEFR